MKRLAITGGVYKNYRLTCPPGEIRPATNIMREAVFQILDNKFHLSKNDSNQFHFLDLFSGSGLMAIEAVSKGFAFATGVEKDRLKWQVILKNFSIAPNKFKLIKDSAEKFLLLNTKPFDVINVDPPFNYAYKHDLMNKIIVSRTCTTKSVIIIHIPQKEHLATSYNSFIQIDSRNYGGSAIHIYQYQE